MSCAVKPFDEPPVAKYMEPSTSSKAVDLVNVCRRMIADWQYQDEREFGNFVKLYKVNSTTPIADPISYRLIQEFVTTNLNMKMGHEISSEELESVLKSLPTTRYSVKLQLPKENITAKKFKADPTECLKPEELLKIYWRLRMRYSSPNTTVVISRLIDQFKGLGYAGFLLPNGKVVPFDSMRLMAMSFLPKELNLIDYQGLDEARGQLNLSCESTVLEGLIIRFDRPKGFMTANSVFTFKLPEMDEVGNFGKLMVLDPTCAQYGMTGGNGELLYWGSFEDYINSFPAKKIFFHGFCAGNKGDESKSVEESPLLYYSFNLMKAVIANLNSDFCGYCGEVERKENPEMKLKKCSKCKKVSYCDALCQKMAWKGHKLKCKSN